MKKTVLFLIVSGLLLSLAACGSVETEPTTEVTTEATEVTETTEAPEVRCRELCDAGMDALENGDLAAAREAFEGTLAIDEGFVDAYLGLSEVLIRECDFEAAEALLTEGLEKTGSDPAIAEKLEMLQSASIVDSDGKVRRANGYNGEGVLLYYHVFTYSADGRKESVTSYDAEGNQTGFVQLEYDDQGRPVVDCAEYAGPVGRIELAYDEAGNNTEQYYYDPDGKLTLGVINTFDETGKLIRSEQYEETVLRCIEHYSYDSQGWCVRADYCDGNDVLMFSLVYTRNDSGKVIETLEYSARGTLTSRIVFTYGEDGTLLKEEKFDGEGNLTDVYEYE